MASLAREMNALVDHGDRFLADADFATMMAEVKDEAQERRDVLQRWVPRISTVKMAWEQETPVEEGLHVEVHGLYSREDLNGQRGYAGTWRSESNRIGVTLFSADEAGEAVKMAVKPHNLRRAPPAPRSDRARAKELAAAANARLATARSHAALGPMGRPGEPSAGAAALVAEAVALVDEAQALDPACLPLHSVRCDLAMMHAQRRAQVLHARRGVANGTGRSAEERKQRLSMRMALASALGELNDLSGAGAQCRAVLAAQPEHRHARLILGTTLLESRGGADDAEACVQLMMCLDLPPDGHSRTASADDTFREMALEELLHALGRRIQRHTASGDGAALADAERQMQSLIDRYPDAVRACTQRAQLRGAGVPDAAMWAGQGPRPAI